MGAPEGGGQQLEDGVTEPAEAETKGPDLAALKKMFEDSSSLTQVARRQSEIDRDYFDGKQWTAEERNELAKRKQPDNVFNRIRPAVEGVIGVIDQGQADPKAWPRNPGDEQAAEVVTKTLRYAEDKSRLDRTKMDCAEQFYVEGTCAVIVEVDERRDIMPAQVRFEEFFYDPRSRRKDFKDARYMGIAKWRWADDVMAEYPDEADAVKLTLAGAAMGDQSFQDKPIEGAQANVEWVDGKRRRVMVVELYHLEGKVWQRCVFHSGGVLEASVSPYLDMYKQPKCQIEAVSCYVDRDNARYGKVRDMRGPQDEINKRRSKLLHMISVSQIQAVDPSAQDVDADTARKEAARPDGVIPFGWQKVSTADVASGQANLLTEAKAEIERMGPNPAILGRQGEGQSGRANLVRQQAGMTELAPSMGVFDDWMLRVYRAMWECARQFWTAPMFIRVTDDEGAPEFIGINQPPSKPGPDGQPMQGQPMADPNAQPGPDGKPPQMMQDNKPAFVFPDGSMVLGYENSVAEMDVDITLETTPDTANVQQEQFMALVELAKSGVQIPPQILLKASSLPEKQKLLEEMKTMAEQPDPQAEMKSKIAIRGAISEIENTESSTALNLAKAQSEGMKPEIEAYKLAHQVNAAPPPGEFPGASPFAGA